MSINNAVNLQNADFTVAGNWLHNGGFNVNAPSNVNIATTMFLGISSDTMSIGCNSNFNMFTANGTMQINNTNGNFSVFAGTGPTTGSVNIGAHNDINLFTDIGNIGLSSAGNASWNVTTGGIAGGVNVGAGMSVDAVTGNVAIGTGTAAATFLCGSFTGTADMTAGTVLTLTGGTNVHVVSSAAVNIEGVTSFFAGKSGVAQLQMDLITGLITLESIGGAIAISSDVSSVTLTAAGNASLVSSAADVNISATNGNVTLQSSGTFFANILGDQVNIAANNAVSIASSGTTVNLTANTDLILTSTTTQVAITGPQINIGTGTNASTITGDSLQVSTNVSLAIDAPSIVFANTACTTLLMGNATCDITVSATQIDMVSTTYVNIDSVALVQLGHSDATIVQIGNAGTSTLVIQGQLSTQASAIGVPAIVLPAGYSYVIVEDATGLIKRMT